MGLLRTGFGVLPGWTHQRRPRLHFFESLAAEETQPDVPSRRLIGEGAWVNECEDRADVARVVEGDVSAFEGIVRRWQTRLVDLAYRFCYDRSLAEEMAQDAFVRAFRAIRKWRGESTFSTWLHAVALNTYRSTCRRLPPVVLPLEPDASSAAQPDVAISVETTARERMIRRAVLTLPWIYREAVVLYYFHDQAVDSAAATIGVPAGTVKARLSRARAILREKLPVLLREPELEAQGR
ncbi:MAG TPA: RNA polymerase sigma factor [Candidatus Eremiobacteraceae bacterium]|nr:RNA polymerase sigma factor [Candidatus Eremiobacteraceae bacterium]